MKNQTQEAIGFHMADLGLNGGAPPQVALEGMSFGSTKQAR